MAIINKTGIGEGNLIQAEHITRIIDALTSVSSDTIVVTGSFTGSFKGDGSQLTGVTTTNATSASYAATASYLTGTISSASFATTSSYVNPLNQNVIITGSLTISGSGATSLTVQKGAILNNSAIFNGTASFNNTVNLQGMQYQAAIQVSTTDATQTDVWSYAMANGESLTVEATIIGVSASLSNTDAVGGNSVGVARCEFSTSYIVGQSSSSFDSSGFGYTYAAYGLRREVGTSNIHFWVRGLTSTEIDWTVAVRKL